MYGDRFQCVQGNLEGFFACNFEPYFKRCGHPFLTALVGRFGPSALAGFGIGTRIEYVVLPIMFAFGTAATTLVGTNIGAGNYRRAEIMGWHAAACASLFCGLVGVVLALSTRLWVPIFTSDPIASSVTTSYIQIVGPAFLCMR